MGLQTDSISRVIINDLFTFSLGKGPNLNSVQVNVQRNCSSALCWRLYTLKIYLTRVIPVISV